MRISTIWLTLFLALAVPQNPSTGTIQGVVLDNTTGQPISSVDIDLPDIRGQRISAESDADGRFTLAGVPAGTHRVMANKQGYASAQLEGRKRSAPGWFGGVFFTVAAGEQITNAVIRLNPWGIVIGRVVDSNAAPVDGASVSLVQKIYDDQGKLNDLPFGLAQTNDLGEYRIFGIDPGEYYLRVDGEPFSDIRGIYYPGVTDFSRAISVVVKLGADVRVSDVILPPANPSTSKRVPVHVRLINETGAAPGQIWFAHWGLAGTPGNGAASGARFFGDPDSWDIRGGLLPGENEISLGWTTPQGRAFGQKTIQVGTEEMTVDLAIRLGASVTTRAVLEAPDGSTRPLGGLRLSFMGHPSSVQFNPGSTPRTVTNDAGVLILTSVPQIPYDVSFNGLPEDAYIIRARQGSRDLLSETAEVSGETLIDVVVGSGGGTVEGTVLDSKGRKTEGAMVVLVPEPAFRGTAARYASANADQNGRFAVHGIAPGTYKMFSWLEFYGDAPYLNEEFMRTYENTGKEIKIERGQKTGAVELRIADEEP